LDPYRDLSEERTDFRVEAVRIHAEITAGVAEPDQPRNDIDAPRARFEVAHAASFVGRKLRRYTATNLGYPAQTLSFPPPRDP